MRALYEDPRYGFRLLKSNPGFTAVAVFTLALGIAANATVFSWVDRILLHPFPGTCAESEFALFETIKPGAPNGGDAGIVPRRSRLPLPGEIDRGHDDRA
mgnify:CR=1 FL=1